MQAMFYDLNTCKAKTRKLAQDMVTVRKPQRIICAQRVQSSKVYIDLLYRLREMRGVIHATMSYYKCINNRSYCRTIISWKRSRKEKGLNCCAVERVPNRKRTLEGCLKNQDGKT